MLSYSEIELCTIKLTMNNFCYFSWFMEAFFWCHCFLKPVANQSCFRKKSRLFDSKQNGHFRSSSCFQTLNRERRVTLTHHFKTKTNKTIKTIKAKNKIKTPKQDNKYLWHSALVNKNPKFLHKFHLHKPSKEKKFLWHKNSCEIKWR